MQKSYRLVVFDWEGTLGDSLGHILDVLATQARFLQFGELDEEKARHYVTLGLARAVKKLFPHLSMTQHEQLLAAVQEALYKSSADERLFPGAKHIVMQMQRAGLDVAIATNRGQQSLQRALQASGIGDLIKVTRSADQAPPKPSPKMIQELMLIFGVTPSETLMIGDSVSDIEMAANAKVNAIGVDFYHCQEAELRAVGALAVFDDYAQLARYLDLPDF